MCSLSLSLTHSDPVDIVCSIFFPLFFFLILPLLLYSFLNTLVENKILEKIVIISK